MEHFDIIIIGAGIAGCGLAYNLKKEKVNKKILIIDKKEIGANKAYGIREVSEKIIKEYKLKIKHTFDGLNIGTYDNIHLKINQKFNFINYKESCEKLLSKSNATFRQEEAKFLMKKTITTNKNKYSFSTLIDASGHNFFTRKITKRITPMRYWVGKTYTLETKNKLGNFFFFQFSDEDFLEEIYPLGEQTLYGTWKYTKKIDSTPIKPHNKTLFKKYLKESKIIDTKTVVIPCAHVSPIINKHCVCLGDSFGNATTSSASGMDNILDSSYLLAKAIKNNNIKQFQIDWENKYLNNYNKFLTSKLDTFNNGKIMTKIKRYPTRTAVCIMFKSYPEEFVRILDGDPKYTLPKEIQNKFPKYQKLFQIFYYLYISLKYQLSKF